MGGGIYFVLNCLLGGFFSHGWILKHFILNLNQEHFYPKYDPVAP
jgi:hypothetical protein